MNEKKTKMDRAIIIFTVFKYTFAFFAVLAFVLPYVFGAPIWVKIICIILGIYFIFYSLLFIYIKKMYKLNR